MSPIGRIFIVLNLLLAGLFLGWASTNLSTAEDYKQQLATEVEEHAATKTELEAQLATTTQNLRTAENTNNSLRGQKDAAETEAGRLAQDLASERDENTALRADVSGIKSTLDEQLAQYNALVQRAEQYQREKDAAERDKTAADAARDAAQAAQADAEEELAAAEKKIEDMQIAANDAAGAIDDLQVQLQTLVEYTGVSYRDITAMPAIDGAVLAVSNAIEPGLVSINRGENDGVMRGFTFEIYSGGVFKGRVRVENVQPNQCTAVILRTYENRTISQGDSASTHI